MAAEDNQSTSIPPESFAKLLELSELLLAFGRVDRITCHPDGTTPESDTDHTVMLGILACAFAEAFAPGLDRGSVAQFALIHDLVEVYAGDTATYRILSEEDVKEKAERERQALLRIKQEYDAMLPWIGRTLEEYESLASPEARFVKTIDKVLPKVTHILNKGAVSIRLGHSKESKNAFLSHQYDKIAGSYGADQPEALALLKAVHTAMMEAELS